MSGHKSWEDLKAERDSDYRMTVAELAAALGHELHSCGYPADSFACKIRHLQVNTGAAKAANDV